MYSRPLHTQPRRLAYKCASSFILTLHHCSTTSKEVFFRAQRNSSRSLTWPARLLAANHGHSRLRQTRCFRHNRRSSNVAAATVTSLADIEYRVCELERTAQLRRLNVHDVQHEMWPLLASCTSIPLSSKKCKISQEQSLFRAKLCSRILELCLNEVEARRVFLWDWLIQTTTITNNGSNTNNKFEDNFSPTKFWSDAPHPKKQMFNLVLYSWKNVIESCSYNSIKDENAMDLMEKAAKEASALLLLMEDEYSSDVAFIQEYNSRLDQGRFTSLMVGAALPDVMNYSEVIGAWGQCIDGSALRLPDRYDRGRSSNSNNISSSSSTNNSSIRVRDGALQRRLRLEACAMKAMMELLESMEEDLYETFFSETTHQHDPPQRKKPAPDRICYNIILASMARQLNPSLYEMRLVLQRMMERVKYELESQGDADDDNHHNNAYSMSFFPDIFSYNALIEARANRAAMFTTDTNTKTSKPQFDMQELNRPQSRWRKKLTEVPRIKYRFTSSEEEAILAEQILEEINSIATVSIRPNIWTYNAVIKAWIKCGTERGLHRSVLMMRSLALNGTNCKGIITNDATHASVNEDAKLESSTSLFERIAFWGASLLSKDDSSVRRTEESRMEHVTMNKSKTDTPQLAGVGIANRLHYLAQEQVAKKTSYTNSDQISVGMHSRMSLMSSAFQSYDAHSAKSRRDELTGDKGGVDSIGPLPHIEPDILPDINTFRLLINAMERRGSITSAKLAEDLLQLLDHHYFELSPPTAMYNSVLNAWSRAGKMANDAKVSYYAANRATTLLNKMLGEERLRSNMLPPPNESSFLMVINAWAHAADAAIRAGNISDANNAANNAEKLLQKLEMQPLETRQIALSCRGSVVRILASLSGIPASRGGYAARAQTLLMTMAEESGRLPVDVIYFNAVLDAWARDLSRKDDDQIMSRLSTPFALLMGLIDGKYNAAPDNSSFNHVIRALYTPWTSRQNIVKDWDQKKAWEMAFYVYSKMADKRHGACRPDAHTYAHMFKAIACLWPKATAAASDERWILCKNIFHSCCQDGQLTKTSFWVLSTLLERSELMDLLSDEMRDFNTTKQLHQISKDRLYAQMPAEWSRNGRNCKSLNRHKQ